MIRFLLFFKKVTVACKLRLNDENEPQLNKHQILIILFVSGTAELLSQVECLHSRSQTLQESGAHHDPGPGGSWSSLR